MLIFDVWWDHGGKVKSKVCASAAQSGWAVILFLPTLLVSSATSSSTVPFGPYWLFSEEGDKVRGGNRQTRLDLWSPECLHFLHRGRLADRVGKKPFQTIWILQSVNTVLAEMLFDLIFIFFNWVRTQPETVEGNQSGGEGQWCCALNLESKL